MTTSFVTKRLGAVGLARLVVVGFALTALGCTNLDEDPPSAITPAGFYRNEGEVLSSLAGIYAQLRSTLDDYYNLSEITTDEMIVPTRGSDWYDGGVWLEMHHQTWTPVSSVGNGPGNGVWVVAFTGIARSNALLEALPNLTFTRKDSIAAETRALRAFYYYILMDTFGGVPIATTTEITARAKAPRDSVFRFVEAELLAARPLLPVTWGAGSGGRMTKGSVDAILANMYLNAGVFAKNTGVNTSSYNSCTTVQIGAQNACQAAIAAVDAILNSAAGYQLADSFAQSFRSDNAGSKENIFVIKFAPVDGLGLNFVMRSLHYNQYTPTPWNGFAILAETFTAFDSTDQRRKVILQGPQFNVETGAPAKDRAGNPLVFTTNIADPTQATEGEGPRLYKWPADPKHVQQNNGNDYAWFRLGEMLLIKAEALNELTPGDPAALVLLNQLRARPMETVAPALAGTVTRDMILNERRFELTGEAKRRQDLIRYGRYTLAWGFKPASDPRSILMPIPQTQLDANPLLTQNNGY
jgi:hypothetical protein